MEKNQTKQRHFPLARYSSESGILHIYTPESKAKDGLAEFLENQGFERVAIYGNLPNTLLASTLEEKSAKYNAKETIAVPLQYLAGLIDKVVTKDLSPYAIFVQR